MTLDSSLLTNDFKVLAPAVVFGFLLTGAGDDEDGPHCYSSTTTKCHCSETLRVLSRCFKAEKALPKPRRCEFLPTKSTIHVGTIFSWIRWTGVFVVVYFTYLHVMYIYIYGGPPPKPMFSTKTAVFTVFHAHFCL